MYHTTSYMLVSYQEDCADLTGQWNCSGLIVTFFQHGCLATSKNNGFKLEVIGNNVTNIGEQFNGIKATVNELQTEMKSPTYCRNT